MKLENNFTIHVPIDTAWEALNNPETVAPCFPGATLTSYEGDSFAGTVKVKLGPIAMTYKGKGTYVSRDEAAHEVVIEASGRDSRGNGTANAKVTASIVAEARQTAVSMVTDMTITGKPAQFGRGVISDVADKIIGQFSACVARRLGRASAADRARRPRRGRRARPWCRCPRWLRRRRWRTGADGGGRDEPARRRDARRPATADTAGGGGRRRPPPTRAGVDRAPRRRGADAATPRRRPRRAPRPPRRPGPRRPRRLRPRRRLATPPTGTSATVDRDPTTTRSRRPRRQRGLAARGPVRSEIDAIDLFDTRRAGAQTPAPIGAGACSCAGGAAGAAAAGVLSAGSRGGPVPGSGTCPRSRRPGRAVPRSELHDGAMRPGPNNALTDVAGLRVGHARVPDALSGTTVVLAPAEGAVAGVDVRGGAPGTRETDLLDPRNTVQRVHAIVLSGGSAFGLAAADGVMARLAAAGVGFPVPGASCRSCPPRCCSTWAAAARQAIPAAPDGRDRGRRRRRRARRAGRAGRRGRGHRRPRGRPQGRHRDGERGARDGVTVAALAAVNAAGSAVDPATGGLHGARLGHAAEFVLPAVGATARAALRAVADPTARGSARRRPSPSSPPTSRSTRPDARGSRRWATTAWPAPSRRRTPWSTATWCSGSRPARARLLDVAGLMALHAAAADVVSRAVVHAVLAAETATTPAGTFRSYREVAAGG